MLTPDQQKRLLAALRPGRALGKALDKIVRQDFDEQERGRGGGARADAILWSLRGPCAIADRKEKEKTPVLVGLYDNVLAKPEFKLEERHAGKPESKGQTEIDDFVNNGIADIKRKVMT